GLLAESIQVDLLQFSSIALKIGCLLLIIVDVIFDCSEIIQRCHQFVDQLAPVQKSKHGAAHNARYKRTAEGRYNLAHDWQRYNFGNRFIDQYTHHNAGASRKDFSCSTHPFSERIALWIDKQHLA